ncbi:MAG: signal peptide peptidase SppA [Deltaproteobacteria bacterium]|nr:MAG: signal peptide peptidase SppA [Deltaproteobacteria bacterium]
MSLFLRVRLLLFPIGFLILLSSCTLVQVNLGPRTAPFKEHTITGSGPDKVLLVSISGLMMEGRPRLPGPPWSVREDQTARLAEELGRARQDPGVKALVVKINSPGGTVSAADIMRHQIESFRKETGAKVVASLMGVAASGGYYVALAADKIVALPTTITGSIGVISLKLNLAGLMSRYGVETETVKSAPLKDMWSPFRPASLKERRIMQGLIDEFFQRFKALVQESRPGMSAAKLERAAGAQVFTAAQALDLGLIDKVAYPEEAFEMAKKMAGLEKARLVVYHRPGTPRPGIYAQSAASMAGLDAAALLGLAGAPRLMYLWLPGLR